MVYSNNFVATVKVGGKILREQSGVVALPFGSEYSIYLKNQNSVRALVRVSVDGNPLSDVSDGWFIIEANNTLELERFIKNGNFNKGNRLKFIERTGAVEEHRGIGVDDGLVRVEYKFEKIIQWTWTCYPQWYNCNTTAYGTAMGVATTNTVTSTTTPVGNISLGDNLYNSCEAKAAHVNMCSMQASLNDAGVTVAGGVSNQMFSWGSWFPTEGQSHVIVLKLVGRSGDAPVVKPVTVCEKPTCTTCGKVNKASHKFCARCGTALQLFG